MKSLIKEALRPIYNSLRNQRLRTFHRLLSKYGNAERFKKASIKFDGFTMEVPDPVSFVYQYKEIFLEESYRFSTDVKSPVIIDCGANVGTSCLYFSKMFPSANIIAFEADPKIFSFLKLNLETNGVTNVLLTNKAVWTHDEGVIFHQEGADGGSVVSAANSTSIKLPSIRLKDLLKEPVDFLKIDIEGAEANVLIDCGDALKNVRNIFFEYHSFRNEKQRLAEILSVISAAGFRYYIHSPGQLASPFSNVNAVHHPMDLQLNIYCYRS